MVFYIKKISSVVGAPKDKLVVGFVSPFHKKGLSRAADHPGYEWNLSDYYKGYTKLSEETDLESQAKARDEMRKNATVSKIEEDEAFQYIRQVLAAEIVKRWNKQVKRGPDVWNHYKQLKPITVEDVVRNLRKTKHLKYGDSDNVHTTDYIEYEAKVPSINTTFKFHVDKAYVFSVGWRTHAGFDDPFALQGHSYEVGYKPLS